MIGPNNIPFVSMSSTVANAVKNDPEINQLAAQQGLDLSNTPMATANNIARQVNRVLHPTSTAALLAKTTPSKPATDTAMQSTALQHVFMMMFQLLQTLFSRLGTK